MLDGLLGRGAFYSKCKSLIKMTKTRIEAISRKRKATEKFLRKDIADLLACGLESKAYDRIGGLVEELILTSCYDFIDYVCEIVLKQLSLMQKHSECPEDCREAVASLMYAAARFSDLPELRDLRNIFQERYGSSLDYYVDQKLVENIASKPPADERKFQLMQDIASEFSIKWDAWGFKRRMSNPSPFHQDQPKTQVPLLAVDRRYVAPRIEEKVQKPEKIHGLVKKRNEVHYQNSRREDVVDNGHQMHVGKEGVACTEDQLNQRLNVQEVTSNRSKQPCREEISQKKKEHEISSLRRQFMVDANGSLACENSYEPNYNDGRQETVGKDRMRGCGKGINAEKDHGVLFSRRELMIDEHDSLSHESTSKVTTKTSIPSSSKRLELGNGYNQFKMEGNRKVVEPKADGPSALPQRKAYRSPSKSRMEVLSADKDKDDESCASNSRTGGKGAEEDGLKSNVRTLIPPPYFKPRKSKHRAEIDLRHPENGVHNGGSLASLDAKTAEQLPTRHDLHNNERHGIVGEGVDGHGGYTDEYYRDHNMDNPKPKQRSSRRRHLKSVSSVDGNSNADEEARVVPRISSSRRTGESRKGLQILFDDGHCKRNDEEEQVIDQLLLHYCQKHPTVESASPKRHPAAESTHPSIYSVNEARNRTKAVADPVPPPARSMSLPRQQSTPSEPKKVFSRAASFQPEILTPAKHVHPKLPDYDDIAARFAALRRKKDEL
ncbi:hypothetical protein Dimus_026484 [Dionaea muscipula]